MHRAAREIIDMQLVHHALRARADAAAAKPAVICAGASHSFGELDRDSDRIARALQDSGLIRGDRAAIIMDNSYALVVAIFGVLKAGGVIVVLDPTTRNRKLAFVLADCGARFAFAHTRLARTVEPAVSDCASIEQTFWAGETSSGRAVFGSARSFEGTLGPNAPAPDDPDLIDQDLCAIVYTSGATGTARGVMLTHRNVSNTAWAISTFLDNTPDDVVVCILPLAFDYGLYQIFTAAVVGFTVLLERPFAYPYRLLEQMEAHRVTGLPGIPTVFALLLQMAPFTELNLSRLRYITSTSAALPAPHITQLASAFEGARIFSMYGLAECTNVSYLDPARVEEKIGSVGKAMPNCEAYVVDEGGRRVGPGVAGELVVRGASVMRGYWGDVDASNERLRDGEIMGERVLYTGDVFQTDEDGFLYFIGRKDDIFKCRGEKVSPKEIEDVLHWHPEIADAVVVGVDDPIDGSAIAVFAVPSDGATLTRTDVLQHCRASLEIHKVPKMVEILSSLPRTASGQVDKRALQAAFHLTVQT